MFRVLIFVLWFVCNVYGVKFYKPAYIGDVYYADGFWNSEHVIYGQGRSHVYQSFDNGQTFRVLNVKHSISTNLLLHTDGSRQDYGDAAVVKNIYGRYVKFSSTYYTSYTTDGRFVTHNANVTFNGLPRSVYCVKKFGGCPMRLSGTGVVRVPSSGKFIQSAIVYWGGNGDVATTIVVFESVDGISFHYLSTVVNASTFPSSQEGPNENDMTFLNDGKTIMMVIRMDAGDGPETHPFKNYRVTYSKDYGATWSHPVEMENIGCARPRLHMMNPPNGPLILSGGRAQNRNTSDVLMWVNLNGDGLSWREYSISYWHNFLTTNSSWRFDSKVNATGGGRETTSYTSIVPTGSNSAIITYDKDDMGFAMKFSF